MIAGSSDELDRMVRKQIGDVTLCLHELAIYVEPLVVVRPLTRKRNPMAKTRSRGVVRGAHVPLTNKSRVVTNSLKFSGKRWRCAIKRCPIGQNLVTVRVLASENRSPTRRTQRSCDKSVFKHDTLVCQTVEMWCLEKRMPRKRERIVALIVNQNEYDVGTVIGTLSKGASRNNAEDGDQQRQNATA